MRPFVPDSPGNGRISKFCGLTGQETPFAPSVATDRPLPGDSRRAHSPTCLNPCHGARWLSRFVGVIEQHPEIFEAYRTSGDVHDIQRVVARDMADDDALYELLIEEIELYGVRTIVVMEERKRTTALPRDAT